MNVHVLYSKLQNLTIKNHIKAYRPVYVELISLSVNTGMTKYFSKGRAHV